MGKQRLSNPFFNDINAAFYRVRQNYGDQDLMDRYKFNSLSAINLTRGLNLFINVNEQI